MNTADQHGAEAPENGLYPFAVAAGRKPQAVSAQLVEEYSPLPNNDADEVARELQRARGKGLFSGFFLIWRLRYEAWLEERLRQEIARKLATRTELSRCHNQAVVAQNELRANLLAGQSTERQRFADAHLASVPTQFVDIGEGETIRVPMPAATGMPRWDGAGWTQDGHARSGDPQAMHLP